MMSSNGVRREGRVVAAYGQVFSGLGRRDGIISSSYEHDEQDEHTRRA